MDIKMATNKPKRKTYSDEFKEFLVENKKPNKPKPTKYPHLLTMTLTAIHQHSSLSVYSQNQTVSKSPISSHQLISPDRYRTTNSHHNAMPIKLTIDQIDNYSLIELLRGLQ
jgi:transposase